MTIKLSAGLGGIVEMYSVVATLSVVPAGVGGVSGIVVQEDGMVGHVQSLGSGVQGGVGGQVQPESFDELVVSVVEEEGNVMVVHGGAEGHVVPVTGALVVSKGINRTNQVVIKSPVRTSVPRHTLHFIIRIVIRIDSY